MGVQRLHGSTVPVSDFVTVILWFCNRTTLFLSDHIVQGKVLVSLVVLVWFIIPVILLQYCKCFQKFKNYARKHKRLKLFHLYSSNSENILMIHILNFEIFLQTKTVSHPLSHLLHGMTAGALITSV